MQIYEDKNGLVSQLCKLKHTYESLEQLFIQIYLTMYARMQLIKSGQEKHKLSS